ncbi:sigma-70 family RNA polymerase sigma factor [SAR92 clade bacterium H455]|uniref:Sigma-70 family RNA polymerase sigma factor n=1 Tax=SAR92 clade bacterium H455 TaxID=2974818 RepID=A0ABY5TKI3_9GAMM|nr:sigma-70 family RNA polymerase sigma factor [SAR92 clade bacterium H455]
MKALVDQYQRTLVSFFMRRSRNAWDAEELTQEVFCKIWKRRDIALSDYSDAYMFTIAWSVLRDRLRREKVRHHDMHVEYDEELAREDPVTPQDIVRGEELYEYYLRLLESLSPRVREVFILSRYESLTYIQIAKHCAISVSAVEKYMMIALKRMKEILKEPQ